MAGELTLRVQRGEVVVEVRGDAQAVQAAFSDLKTSGIGALATFFGLAVSPIGIGAQPGATQPIGQPGAAQPTIGPGSTPPLTSPAASFRFVFDALPLPTNQRPSADDIDGDGRPDNGFANIIRSFAESLSLDFQGQIDSDLKAGNLLLLLTLATELATPGPDQRAAVTLFSGKPVKHSDRVYAIDLSTPAVTLQGRIVAGRFASDDPRTSGTVAWRDLPLSLGPGVSATLPVQGLRLAFDVSVDGSAISNGQLTGSLKQVDVQSQLVPALAMTLTSFIQNAEGSPAAQNIQNLLDKGGCTNPNGSAAQPGDGVIDVCELLTNPLMTSILQPDVQIYDAQGNYAPNPLGGNPDSTSMGLGFSATRASY